MKKTPTLLASATALSLLATLISIGVPAVSAQNAPTIERAMSLPLLGGTPPVDPAWSRDSARLAFLWNEDGYPFRDVWVWDAASAEPRQLTHYAPRDLPGHAPDGDVQAPSPTLDELRDVARSKRTTGVSEILWDRASRGIYFLYGGDLYRVAIDSGETRRLTRDGGRKSDLGMSPDEARLSFLDDGDLWLLRFSDHALVKATSIGEATPLAVSFGRFNGSKREITSYAWSRDSAYVALHQVDRSHVGTMSIPSYIGSKEPKVFEVKRPYPGQDDAIKTLGIYTLADGVVRNLALPEPIHRNVLNYEWSPVDNRLLVEQESDEGEHRWLFVIDVPSDAYRLEPVYHDHRPRRIYSVFTSHWGSAGKRIYFIDDNSERYRIASVSASGAGFRIVTTGDYDVAGSSGRPDVVMAHASREIFYTAAAPTPYERQIFAIDESGGAARRVTTAAGVHEDFVLSPDGKSIAVISSADLEPADLFVLSARSPSSPLRLTSSPSSDFDDYAWVEPRYVQFPSRIDDFTLHARIIEPPNLDAGKRYPVILGNVYSNTVRNSWSTRGHPTPERISPFQQAMAIDGEFITVQVDLRGSIGYGVDFRETFQGDWGGDDLEDIHSTVDYLKSIPYVDPDRIAIWGNSYGGMLVLFALFEKPGMFAAGVAGAPAVDVSKFTSNDQHLSRRPQTHPEIFRKSTLLNYGEHLSDPLLLIHGLHDDIVPVQSTFQMYEKLLLLGKHPDLIVAPTSSHWWASDEHYAVHAFTRIGAFFERFIGAGASRGAPGE